ncbi:NUDIX hydrolase [Clostridium perfringens]|uniref:Putative ADP-ribose pyrophosphatase n=1 Tax=Clostridium perfringens TaxID=1502 RepID=A0A140GRB2_CLOPF|nr:NUDIX domain-containing protein [Clostridium perfringens]AMN31071.1 putative ADP-ribose pyrophosphatase [Clostridium perfringens]
MNRNFLDDNGLSQEEFLKNYNPGDYERPSCTVDMLLFTVSDKYEKLNSDKVLKILLIKRKAHPYANQWAIPGGFVDMNENIEESVYRELEEETNIKDNVYFEQLYTWGAVDRDPRTRVISTSFMALADSNNLSPKAGDDAKEVQWFCIDRIVCEKSNDKEVYIIKLKGEDDGTEIGYKVTKTYYFNGRIRTPKYDAVDLELSNSLAFDHYKLINKALDVLRDKIKYTPIVFNIVPEFFTISELQKTCEAIIGEKYIPNNFRRDMKKFLLKTDKKKDTLRRKATLYKFNPYY